MVVDVDGQRTGEGHGRRRLEVVEIQGERGRGRGEGGPHVAKMNLVQGKKSWKEGTLELGVY